MKTSQRTKLHTIVAGADIYQSSKKYSSILIKLINENLLCLVTEIFQGIW